MTTLQEFQSMTQQELTAWLVADAFSHEPQVAMVQTMILAGVTKGMPHEFIRRWLAANREAAHRLLAEADQLDRYGRCRKAGITGVVDGGSDAA